MTAPDQNETALRPLVVRVLERAAADPQSIAYAVYPHAVSRKGVRQFTWGEWATQSRALAGALLADGASAGERVAVISSNKLLWPVAEIGITMAGLISVGIPPASATSHMFAILADCGARTVIVDTLLHLEQLLEVRARLPYQVTIVCEDLAPPLADPRPHVHAWIDWISRGAESLDASGERRNELRARVENISLDDIATLMYAASSARDVTGVRLSHRYIAASAASAATALDLTNDDSGVSWLPFCDVFERVLGLYARVHVGMSAALVEQASDVFAIARHFEPTVLMGHARYFEDIQDAVDVALLDERDPRWEKVAHVGSRIRVAICIDELSPAVSASLDAIGLRVVRIYGNAEHLCVAMGSLNASRFDAIGPLMPGTRVQLAADRELWVCRDDRTFDGYWKRDELSRNAFDTDGKWYKTGDLATIDASGVLRITGRAAEVIVLATGKSITPAPVEAALAQSPFVAHAICHGNGRNFLTVLLVLRRGFVEQWARAQGLDVPWDALAQHSLVRKELQKVVQAVNHSLGPSEQLTKFAVTEHEFSVAGGELSPALGVVRSVVSERFRHVVDDLYES